MSKKLKIGDIVRYGSGSTALMRISHISECHSGKIDRYYGQQCMGGSVGVYEDQCVLASTEDRETWEKVRKQYTDILPWKDYVKSHSSKHVVGTVED